MTNQTLSYLMSAFACLFISSCKTETPTRLTDANIRQMIADMNAASAKFDAATICSMVDEAATISLKQIKFSGPESMSMSKEQYCRFVADGMQALARSGATYETSTVVDQINISSEGTTGEVKYSSTDHIVAGGQTLRGSFAGTSDVAWKNGRVMVTSVRGVVQFSQ